ncbi:MAG: zinc-ribbon domain-containing protein [Clostridia bacterium]|nr:zinc-ribbon domain-containing protein [Clostridia bacterium]
MFCSNCGKEIPNDSAFCPYCGAKNQAANAVQNPIPQPQMTDARPPEAAQPHGAPAPATPPMRPPVQAPQKKKGMPTWGIVLIIVAAVLIIVGAISAIIVGRIVKSVRDYGYEISSELEEWTFDTSANTDTTTEATTEEESTTKQETTTEQQTTQAQKKSKLDVSKVGKPNIKDFAWVKNAPQPAAGELLTGAQDISGRWKAYYVYSNGVKELCNVTIAATNSNVKVAVKPRYINYAHEWVSESKVQGYAYNQNGVLTNGTIRVSGKAGTIVLYSFFERNGKQYAYGKTMLQSGETINIALVRP